MAVASQLVAPSSAVEGNTPTCNEWKRKVVDNIKAEQSCKFKVDPLMKKLALEIEAMRWKRDKMIMRGQRKE